MTSKQIIRDENLYKLGICDRPAVMEYLNSCLGSLTKFLSVRQYESGVYEFKKTKFRNKPYITHHTSTDTCVIEIEIYKMLLYGYTLSSESTQSLLKYFIDVNYDIKVKYINTT